MRERFVAVIEHATGAAGDRLDQRQPAEPGHDLQVFVLSPTDLVDVHDVPASVER
jgi:hypothetical protein